MRRLFTLSLCLYLCLNVTYSQNRSFINMGFETPYTPFVASYNYTFINESSIVGWKTSATDNTIELWGTNFNGIAAKQGSQFVELNANQASRLYQVVYLVNGETLTWDFWHRGRASSTIPDQMQLNIYNQSGTSKLVSLQDQSTTNSAWKNYTGSWDCTLPNGLYQFSFEAISTATGDKTVGNFIDGCNVGLKPIIEFSAPNFSGVEWQGNDNLPSLIVNGTVPTGGTKVKFSIAGGTATNGTDYTIADITIPAGSYTSTNPLVIPLTILPDVNAESSETIIISSNSVTGTTMLDDANGDGVYCSQTTYTIVDNIAPGGVVTGLNVWLRADKGVYSNNPGTTAATQGGNVLYWNDNSPQNNDAVIASAGYPTYQSMLNLTNYNPVLYFSANNMYFKCNLSSMKNSSYSVFSAHTRLSSNEGYLIGALSTVKNQGFAFGYRSDVLGSLDQFSNAIRPAVTTYDNTKVAAILFGMFDLSSGHQITEYRNSSKSFASNSNKSSIVGTAQGAIGVGYSSNLGLIAMTSEIIVYNRALTGLEQQQVSSYLAIKNGVTIDQTTATDYLASDGVTKFWNSSSAGVYKKDIAIIARDDLSGLHQKQSRTQNSSDNLIVAVGGIAASNASNTYSIPADRSALAWANNGGLVNSWSVWDYGVSLNGESVVSRIARVWQMQKTGTVGQTRMSIDLSSISWAVDMQYVRLLVDADGIFANGAQSIAPSSYDNNAKTAEFDYTFTNALSYVSVGSVNATQAPLPITLSRFSASKNDNGSNSVNWQTASEHDVYAYVIERSVDGVAFDSIGFRVASGNSKQTLNYYFEDSSAPFSTCYYRLRYSDVGGVIKYSKVVSIQASNESGICRISSLNFGRTVSFQFISNMPNVHVQIVNLQGAVVRDGWLNSGTLHSIPLPYAGIYFVKVFVTVDECDLHKIVVQD